MADYNRSNLGSFASGVLQSTKFMMNYLDQQKRREMEERRLKLQEEEAARRAEKHPYDIKAVDARTKLTDTQTESISSRTKRDEELHPIRQEILGTQSETLKSNLGRIRACLLYTSPSPRDRQKSRMPSSA